MAKGSGVDSGEGIAERTDAVDRAGITALRGAMATPLARQLILGVRVRHEGVAVAVTCYCQCHLLYCQQSPTGTGVTDEVCSSRHNVASAFELAWLGANPMRDSQQQGGGGNQQRLPGLMEVNRHRSVVTKNKRKLLIRLGQKGTWASPDAPTSSGAGGVAPALRRSRNPFRLT